VRRFQLEVDELIAISASKPGNAHATAIRERNTYYAILLS
jgi:hypothetical protein